MKKRKMRKLKNPSKKLQDLVSAIVIGLLQIHHNTLNLIDWLLSFPLCIVPPTILNSNPWKILIYWIPIAKKMKNIY